MSGAPKIEPVRHAGVRYEALHWGKERDLGQNGGLIAAFDEASGDELWVAKVYAIHYGDKSPRKYDRFIAALALAGDSAALMVTDEAGGEYRFDLASRTATALNEAALAPPSR